MVTLLIVESPNKAAMVATLAHKRCPRIRVRRLLHCLDDNYPIFLGPDIESSRHYWVKRQRMNTEIGQTNVDSVPGFASIDAFEQTVRCARIEGGRCCRVNDQGCNPDLTGVAKSGVDRLPVFTAIRTFEYSGATPAWRAGASHRRTARPRRCWCG